MYDEYEDYYYDYEEARDDDDDNTTPCDYLKDENNMSYCPYNDYGGSDRCRVCCGLGVDD